MTREEAIKRLTVEIGLRSSGYCDYLAHGGKQDVAEEESLDSLQMAISALREQPRWIGVEDRLPECDEKCLCRYTFGKNGGMYFCQVLDYYATDPQPHFQHTLGDNWMRVTHWMPLPEPPKEEV